MYKGIFATVLLSFFVNGCKYVGVWEYELNRVVFEYSGATLVGDVREVTVKEAHLEGELIFGQHIMIEGEILEVGGFDTHVVVDDGTGKMLVVTTKLILDRETHLDLKSGDMIRIFGVVEGGRRGYTHCSAKELYKIEDKEVVGA